MSGADDFNLLVMRMQDAVRDLGRSGGTVVQVEAAVMAAEEAIGAVLGAMRARGDDGGDLGELALAVRSAGSLGACDGTITAGRRVLRYLGLGGKGHVDGYQRGLERADRLAKGATEGTVVAGLNKAIRNVVAALRDGLGGDAVPLPALDDAIRLAQAYLRAHRQIHPVDMIIGDLDILVAADYVGESAAVALGPLSAGSRVLRYMQRAGIQVGEAWAHVADWKNIITDDEGVVAAMEDMNAARVRLARDGRRDAQWHHDIVVLRAMNEGMLWFLREHRHICPPDDNAIRLDLRITSGNSGDYFGPLVAASEILRFLARVPDSGFPDLLDKPGFAQ